jgi:serine-type D-Ala-D-Ala carboxypeptidase/endopeptidase (penicillin-binding protein 4)
MRFAVMRVAICVFIAFASPAAAQTSRLPAPVAQALARSGIPESAAGVVVQDAVSGRLVVAHAKDVPFNPASTIKILTTYAALDQLGPAFTWNTEIYAGGPIEKDVLAGDLVIKGFGDPSLTLESFWLLLRTLRGRGLRDIRGDLVIDRSFFAPANGSAGDFDGEPARPYNTLPDAVLVNFKAVRLDFLPDAAQGAVRIVAEPALSQVAIVNNLKIDTRECGDWSERLRPEIQDNGTMARLAFNGTYSLNCGEQARHYSVLGNAQYVLSLFTLLWRELGGTFEGGVREGTAAPGSRPLLAFPTAPMATIVRDLNKFSNNLMARQLFLAFGAIALGAPATNEKSAAAVRKWLDGKGLLLPELVLENGSGLSRSERISAQSLAQLLTTAYHSAVGPELIASLPVVAADGTMKKRLNDTRVAGQAHVKTGSLANVRAIAGYVLDHRAHPYVVVCLVNHARAEGSRAAQDALLQWVYYH